MSFHPTLATLSLLTASCLTAPAQSGSCAAPPQMQLTPGSRLTIASRSGDIEVVGTAQEGIHVTCKLDHQEQAGEIHISFAQKGGSNRLRLHGGPSNNVSIRIEVPQRTDLEFHTPAGELKVKEITGDKDLHLHFGEITVTPVSKEEYGKVEASTLIGDVNIPAQGVSKDGFFRSFAINATPGKYHLKAHVTTGEINLQ